MRTHLPVTQQEYLFPDSQLLVSMTDTRGVITHCNAAFASTSGYTGDELVGQPHNLIRHPDMPAAAFKDMWRTIGGGQPWTGVVKNRRKNGDHYWVEANVTPVMENGKPSGYMSVRVKPSRAQVAQAQALYDQLRAQGAEQRPALSLQGGRVVRRGVPGWAARLRRAPLTLRLAALLLAVGGLSFLPDALGWQNTQALLARAAILGLGLGTATAWFHGRFSASLAEAVRFAGELSSCNLTGAVATDLPEPFGALMRRLRQIQVNLRAVVGDVRNEIARFTVSASEIAQASLDLSARTESQASSLEQTAASMEELASTVRQTADTAVQMSVQSEESKVVARRGEQSVLDAESAMGAIEQSSRQIAEITGVIESIAFQTNILALNAAVEAARAGAHGRGFAVVAGEVRSLAQRSATAAKEIKQLIGESAHRTAEGAGRIRSAGGTLNEVMSSVSQVSAMVRQIAGATKEQALGISQVNEAVLQLDVVTQQNAALVEESAASASALSSSARSLKASVSVFHMPGDARHAAIRCAAPLPVRAAGNPDQLGRPKRMLQLPRLGAT
ncbi:MAG TPA: methyl-accepting chemotaxis protein [Burkholderiaceae bacterium]|nr:methyl-accepting chemotaxis protein [Burkholderiaceae bacterium]